MVHKNIIIGAGPSGLAMAGQFSKNEVPYIIIEKSTNVGNEWRNHYDRLKLHTDKIYSSLPHLPFPAEYPTFVPKAEYIQYLESYIKHFNINPIYGEEVLDISKNNGIWEVKTQNNTFLSENVVVATGYNRVPKIPHFINDYLFEGEKIHSCKYKNGLPYKDKKVLVVGYGNSGAEIALDLCESKAKTYVSIRNPVNIVKREFLGRSTQGLAIFLTQFGNSVYDFISNIFKKISTGSLKQTGIPISPLAPSEQLRKQGKVPVIDVGTLEQIKQKKIMVMPDIREFTHDSIIFVNGQQEKFDAVVLATGYHAHLEKIIKNIAPVLNERAYPKQMWFDEETYKGLYFIGFNLPLTGILRDINISSEKILGKIMTQG
ncbi:MULTISPECIES: NAD(P)/FAD-dependent oxidoreductase [Emticicia]|uniref:flavin-containing monooxygenase n=1 Tax=Emticicia TaxID=312278 RepID=UPI0007D8B928|nr:MULTISPECIES: NAD(P)/FAD-dependent oxidoreductase [Emticicia]